MDATRFRILWIIADSRRGGFLVLCNDGGTEFYKFGDRLPAAVRTFLHNNVDRTHQLDVVGVMYSSEVVNNG